MFNLLKQKAVVVVTGLAMVIGTMGVVGTANATPMAWIDIVVEGDGGARSTGGIRTVNVSIFHDAPAAQCAANSNCLKQITFDLQGGTDTNAQFETQPYNIVDVNVGGTIVATRTVTTGDGLLNFLTIDFSTAQFFDPSNSYSFDIDISGLNLNNGGSWGFREVPITVMLEDGQMGNGVFVQTIQDFQSQDSIHFDAPTVLNPEPSTMLLLGSGLVGLIGYRWKKAQA